MTYWSEVMQDDCYLIATDGWRAQTNRIIETNKKGTQVDKGWTCDLIPKGVVINRYFTSEQQVIDDLNAELERLQSQMLEMEEEHDGEDSIFTDLEKINKGNITARLRELKEEPDTAEEQSILKKYVRLLNQEADTKKATKDAESELDAKLLDFYPILTEMQIKELVVEDKWMATIDKNINSEMDRISQRLNQRIKELVERYEIPLPTQTQQAIDMESVVNRHLQKMGFVWN